MVETINAFSSTSGVKARVAATGGGDDIELYASDGRNIDVAIAAGAASDGAGTINAAFRITTNVNTAGTGNVLFSVAVNTTAGGAGAGLLASTTGLFTGAVELRSANAIILSDDLASYLGVAGVTAVDKDTAIFSIDISTQLGAQNALGNIDATLSQLNELRSSLGAVQNRLDSTVRNISISLENISSAQSQIRDADIAAETAELTRAQILQQAGIAVLGQANTSSQVALSLLQF
jgi:flagellin